MGFEHQFPYGDVNELNLDWIIQTMQEFINSEREAGHTPTVSGVKSFFTHKYPYGSIHELNLDWVIQTALRMEEIGGSVEGDIGELQTRMTAAEGNISTLDNTVSGLSDSIGQIETEMEEIQGDVTALETTVGQHTTQITALDAKIDSQVVANPADAATDTLSKIKIAGAVYTVEGSGGSEVEANPAGEPTDTLKKIGIDGTIYGVGGSEPVSKTATGNPIHIEDAADAPIVSGTVAFEPKQDLHGYDKPWAGGAGKNKLPMTVDGIKAANTDGTWSGNAYTANGVTFTIQTDADGNVVGINANGNASSDATLLIYGRSTSSSADITFANDVIASTGYIGSSTTARGVVWGADGGYIDSTEKTILANSAIYGYGLSIANGYNAQNIIFYPMIRLATETDPTFEPYSNICPIMGYDECEVEVTDDATSPAVTNTYTIDLDGTRYGGTVDLVSGVMTVTRSYAEFDGSVDEGWTWNEAWASSCFSISNALPSAVYISGYMTIADIICNSAEIKAPAVLADRNTLTYGVGQGDGVRLFVNVSADIDTTTKLKTYLSENPLQVVYPLATPFTVQLTPEQIRTLEGTNNISTNMTDMSLEYITQDYQPLVKLIEQSVGHHYSEQERVVGTWLGKTLYEKVVDFGALPNATTKDLNHGIANVDTIFIVGGYAKNTTSGFVQQLNVPVPSNNQTDMQSQWYFGVTATYIRCFTLTDRTSYDECKVILQYTKTTD